MGMSLPSLGWRVNAFTGAFLAKQSKIRREVFDPVLYNGMYHLAHSKASVYEM